MLRERVQHLVVGLVVILLVVSALGYLLVPAAMLGIVGMDSNPQVTFLVRTLAAALLALSPAAWAARRRDGTSGQRSVLIGLAGYMFASSLVDLYGFINQVVGVASVPSIALRVILGAVLVWLIPAHNGRQPSDLGPSAGPPARPSMDEPSHRGPSQVAVGSSQSGGTGCSCRAGGQADGEATPSAIGADRVMGVATTRPARPLRSPATQLRGPLSHPCGSVRPR